MRLFPRKFKSRLIFLGIASVTSVVAFYFLGALAIQSLLVVWNIAIVLGIIIWEKEKAQNYRMNTANFSQDERWSGIEREIQWTENQLKETYSKERRHGLQSKLLALRGQKRKLEWKIKEENLDALYNTQNRSLREIDKFQKYSDISRRDTVEDREEIRERTEKQDRKYLDDLLKNAVAILNEEPGPSLGSALNSISNDIKAHYNEIKKRDGFAASLSDYWVALMIVQSVISGSAPDSKIVKYATRSYAPHFSKVLAKADYRVAQIAKEGPSKIEGEQNSIEIDEVNDESRPEDA